MNEQHNGRKAHVYPTADAHAVVANVNAERAREFAADAERHALDAYSYAGDAYRHRRVAQIAMWTTGAISVLSALTLSINAAVHLGWLG